MTVELTVVTSDKVKSARALCHYLGIEQDVGIITSKKFDNYYNKLESMS